MACDIKRTAIPASGYLYQTLVGIRLLCDWLDDPGLYEWVQFEADDQPDARGLDDIVAQRPDRLIDLIQVKFTVDPFDPANAPSWAWLLERKGARGRSLLEKWSRAAFNVGLDRVGRLALTTNRRPDADFALQPGGDRVDLASLSSALRQQVTNRHRRRPCRCLDGAFGRFLGAGTSGLSAVAAVLTQEGRGLMK